MGVSPPREHYLRKGLADRFLLVREAPPLLLVQGKATRQELAIREIQSPSPQRFAELQARLQTLQQGASPFVVQVVEQHELIEEGNCSTWHSHLVVFDLPHKTLAAELKQRVRAGRPFKERELWSVLVSVVSAMHWLGTRTALYLPLALADIFISRDGLVKICEGWLLDGRSPEPPGPAQAGVLALALAILSLGLLQEFPLPEHSAVLAHYLSSFQTHYGAQLCSILKRMCF
jgi:hypothetical protein